MTEEQWIQGGKISAQALEYGETLIKPGALLYEVAEKVEAKILELGARMAFPCNISINDLAAHYTPNLDSKEVFNEGDIVKLDVGAQIDGHIGDNAVTIEVGNSNEHSDLIKAPKEAVEEAIKVVKPGLQIREIGRIIQDKIQEYGFAPVKNLSGHGIEQYTQHASPSIPNYDNGNKNELKEGQVIAIEPFASMGEGLVTEGKPSNIYKIEHVRPTRNPIARQVLKFIQEEYKTLPFAKRWVVKKFGTKANLGFTFLERDGILHSYPQLPERSKALVSQYEKTLMVKDTPLILTKT